MKHQFPEFDEDHSMDTATATQPQSRPGSTVQAAFDRLRTELDHRIIGQQQLVEHLLIALLADGHLLVEGAPGLAKTTAISSGGVLSEVKDSSSFRAYIEPLAPVTATMVFLVGSVIYSVLRKCKNSKFSFLNRFIEIGFSYNFV